MKMLIDTDMGSDDAVALIMGLRSPAVDVIAITTVAGNVHVERATRNALLLRELCGAEHVPVYQGAGEALMHPHQHAEWFHGKDGLSGKGNQEPKGQAEATHAVQAIIQAAYENEDLVIVTLGPLTNLALAIAQAPGLVERISRCVVMGGAAAFEGNVTPAAEYNIWCDPEAARMVFLSGLPVQMVGWEFCVGEHALNEDEMAHIRSLGTPYADFTLDSNAVAIEAFRKQTGQYGLSLPDGVAMAIALDPAIASRSAMHYVEVETRSPLTRGMTVVDKLHVAEDPYNRLIWQEAIENNRKIRVTWEVDIPRWKHLLYQLLQEDPGK